MGANFKQKPINTRERLNALQSHNHDSKYVAKNTVIGKNLLINGDKSVIQRFSDISTPADISSSYTVDRFICYAVGSTLSIAQLAYDDNLKMSPIRLEVTASGVGGWINWEQKVEDFVNLQGRTVTYTAEIRSSLDMHVTIFSASGDTGTNIVTPGTHEWKTVSVTRTLQYDITELSCIITDNIYSGVQHQPPVGEYFEVGREQLELGSEFTGFEVVLPSINMLNCQRYYQPLSLGTGDENIGMFTGVTTNIAYSDRVIFPMRIATPTVTNGTELFSALTGTLGDNVNSVSITGDATTGRVLISAAAVASSFVAGGTSLLVKTTPNNVIVGLDAEIY